MRTKEKNAHEDEGSVQVFAVFLRKVAVILVGYSLKLVVELDAGTADRPKEIRKERRQCVEHRSLRAGKESNASVKD